MTMSETPRESISLNGAPPASKTLVTVTESAAKKVLELRSREGKADARLRLFVKSGGCSGSVSYTHLTLPTKRIV